IALAQAHEVGNGGANVSELGRQLYIGAADLVGKLLCPALINGIGCSVLKRTGKQVTNGLDHGVGQADVEPAASGTQFNMEGGDQDDFVAAADAGKLGMHFGANVFVLDGVDLFPAFCIAVQGQGKQTLDEDRKSVV